MDASPVVGPKASIRRPSTRAAASSQENPEANQDVAGLRAALASGGRRGMCQYQLDKIPAQERYSTGPASLYLCLGNRDAALNALEKGYQNREPYLIVWIIAPEFDPLRSEPRYQKILHDLGLS
jgi:hypothetical protein